MKFTLDWLRDHLKTDKSADELARTLSVIGLEVESVDDQAVPLRSFIVGEVLEAKPHPKAERLQVLQVDTGTDKPLQVVCGAPNARKGIKGVLALPQQAIPRSGEKLLRAEVRGVESEGMLCSYFELNLGDDNSGIIELPATARPGQPIPEVLGLPVVFHAEVTPNRSDYLGVRGIATDLAAAGAGELIPEKPLSSAVLNGDFTTPVTITIQEECACPFFAAFFIKDLVNRESPAWMKERLTAVGLNPKSFLIDITNYLTIDRCRPLHAFDADKLKGNMVLRKAAAGEKFVALDGNTYTLNSSDTVLADEAGVQLLSGIMGALETGVTEETRHVLLICETLEPIPIRRTARRLDVNSDAKYRFERGVDPSSTVPGLRKAADMILGHCGGTISRLHTVGTPAEEATTIQYPIANFEKLIGIPIATGIAQEILEKLGCVVTQTENGNSLTVLPPLSRLDLKQERDITEELIRIYGYEKVPAISVPVNARARHSLRAEQVRKFRIKRLLASRGLVEVCSWSFIDEKVERLLFGGAKVLIENPLTPEHSALRQSLLSNLLPVVKKNQAMGSFNLALFQSAPVFFGHKPGEQETAVCVVLTGNNEEKSWTGHEREFTVYDAKDHLYSVLEMMGLSEVADLKTDILPEGFHPHRSARVTVGKQELGFFGEIHPRVLSQLSIKNRTVFFEIFPDRMPADAEKNNAKAHLVLAKLQAIRRDFAFVLPESFEVKALIDCIRLVDPEIVRAVAIVDIFRGETISAGHKSVAVSIEIQPKEKSLDEKELVLLSEKIVAAVKQGTGGTLRLI